MGTFRTYEGTLQMESLNTNGIGNGSHVIPRHRVLGFAYKLKLEKVSCRGAEGHVEGERWCTSRFTATVS